MHSVADALTEVIKRTQVLAADHVQLGAQLLGRVLASEINSDVDAPPFDKSMMDGIAVRASDAAAGATLTVIEELTAGRVSTKSVGLGQAIRIMTGAPVPAGADAVVMVEECRFSADVVTLTATAKPGQNIQPRAKEMRAGEVIFSLGTAIRPAEIGVLAAVGQASVLVHKVPRVAVISTGDELVEVSAKPGPGQIRNSNGPMLVAQVARAGGQPDLLGIARDTREDLRSKISRGLEFDVLLLSGGVSAGKLDLVPDILSELGVEQHVHKVLMKPGKPLFFGTRGKTLVFGLAGNPLGSFVGFELFVAPALRKLMGHPNPTTEPVLLPLAEVMACGDRPTYHPSKIERLPVGEQVRPIKWHGSADVRGLCRADALALIPGGDREVRAGWPVSVLRLPA